MENYSVVIPSYTVGPESYKKIPEFCRLYGKKAVVIGGERAMAAAKEKLLKALEGSDMEITGFIWFGKECTFAAAKRLPNIPFRVIRIVWDSIAMVIGLVTGGGFGIVTLIMAFCLGPAISAVQGMVTKIWK